MPASKATLPPEAFGAAAVPAPLPPPETMVLTNGTLATWRMPDLLTMTAFDGLIPDPMTAAVIQLLIEEKSHTPESDPRKFVYAAQEIRGLVGLAAAMLESPRLDPTIAYGDGKEVLGRRQIGYRDLCNLYWLFLLTPGQAAPIPPPSDQPAEPTDAPPTGRNLPSASESGGGGE